MGNSGLSGVELRDFDRWELGLLEKMFRDLAKRSPGKTMDKATFLALFKLPGMLGERLFRVFDQKKNGVIDWEEFLDGMKVYSRGSIDEKLTMLFKMVDLAGDNVVHPDELSTILSSLLSPSLLLDAASISEERVMETQAAVQVIVKNAFETCDPEGTNNLSFDQFRRWLEMNPEISDVCRVFARFSDERIETRNSISDTYLGCISFSATYFISGTIIFQNNGHR
jgi:serine/threonine-protein phosphatase 2B regulatory subunit